MKDKPADNTGSQLSARKWIVFVAATLLISIVILESLSALFLFRYFSLAQEAFLPKGSATVYLAQRALRIWPFQTTETIVPHSLYVDDEKLGYTTRPGKYQVALSVGKKTYRFAVTIAAPGTRATGYRDENKPLTMYFFGNSFVFGWGNNDEQTMPWLLQQRFPQYKVLNLAQNGYGITQAVIQYEQLKGSIKKDDLIILPYADYYLGRNYGAPSVLRTNPYKGDRRWPVVRAKANGDWTIEYISADCTKNDGYCTRADPDPAVMVEATKKIFAFFSKAEAKVAVAYLNGPDSDPIIAYARQLGMSVIDIRLDHKSPDWDDLLPFDGHPGPIAQYNFFNKLSKGLLDRGLLQEAAH